MCLRKNNMKPPFPKKLSPLSLPSRAFLVLMLGLTSCAGPGQEYPSATSRATSASAYAEPPHDRPGLGTKWGETRKSTSGEANFQRAQPNEPIATAEIFYNDRAGIEAMATTTLFSRRWPILYGPAATLVALGLRDESGRFLPGLVMAGRWFVVGEEGRRYSILVKNQSEYRLEIVLSVDGLDVLDGRSASLRKRGYVVEPHRTLVVDGFRQSADSVAAFRFGPVRESYAHEKYHNSRNVGVIGAAIFNERGTFPWTEHEVNKRLRANPFPNRFAQPPNE
jgi:hypothetical protein